MSAREKGKGKPRSSWRDLQQKNRRAGSSRVSRRRRLAALLKGSLVILLLVAIAAGGAGLYYLYQRADKPVPEAATHPAMELDFKTDGVLTRDWFRDSFGQYLRADVRQIDVALLKSLLEEVGQVAGATVTVNLPSRLVVRINERVPILRVRVRGPDGEPMRLLIARDGTLYPGFGYPEETLLRLPGVAGLRVRQGADDRFLPVEGLEPVGRLLEAAKTLMPALYRHWQVVDLGDWDPGREYVPSLIRIRSAHIEEIVFAASGIEEQLHRLAEILEHSQRYQTGLPRSIDLSFEGEAVIRTQ